MSSSIIEPPLAYLAEARMLTQDREYVKSKCELAIGLF